jgi:phage terminase large subunit-like protein
MVSPFLRSMAKKRNGVIDMITKILRSMGIKRTAKHSCYGGIDVSSKTGLASFCIVFHRKNKDDDLRVIPFFWIPTATADKEVLKEGSNYYEYIIQGHVQRTEGAAIDLLAIRNGIKSICEVYGCKRIGYNPWDSSALVHALEGDGFEMVEVRQGYITLSAPTLFFKKMVDLYKITFAGNPLYGFMIKNLKYSPDANGNAIIRDNKVSGVHATINALVTVG